jgi:hypothetical protein
VPEFEAWIAEAEKGNKDPVDWALEKGKGEDWASKLDAYLVKRQLARTGARIARLDAEAKEREARIAQMEAQSLAATKGILAAMKSLDAQGRFGPKAVADLNWLFNNGSEEVTALIRGELGKYLKP